MNFYTKSKYNNKKILIDGIKFDSKKEAKRYKELRLLEKAGEIKNLELQKVFELQPHFKHNGKMIRAITYKADFYYYDVKLGIFTIEDTKGYRTKEYKLKYKLMLYKGFEIKEI